MPVRGCHPRIFRRWPLCPPGCDCGQQTISMIRYQADALGTYISCEYYCSMYLLLSPQWRKRMTQITRTTSVLTRLNPTNWESLSFSLGNRESMEGISFYMTQMHICTHHTGRPCFGRLAQVCCKMPMMSIREYVWLTRTLSPLSEMPA